MTSQQLRGLVTATVATVGALVAHAAAGGEVTPVPALLVLVLTAPLALALTPRGRRVDLRILAALALVAQGAAHLTLSVAPAGAGHDHAAAADAASGLGGLGAMALVHLAVAAATVALAAGHDRAALDLARALLGWLLPTWPQRPALPVTARPAAFHVAARPLVRRTAQPRRPRGPPARPVPGTLLVPCVAR